MPSEVWPQQKNRSVSGMNYDTLVPKLQTSGTPWTGLLGVSSDADHCEAFGNNQLIIIARNTTSTLNSSFPVSWLKETREIIFYSLIYGLSLITTISEVVCKKECHEHSNCRCLLWSAEFMQCLTAEAETEFQLTIFQFGVHKGMLDFCLWAFQYGRGNAQKPQDLIRM